VAANSFLDALAQLRRSAGQVGLSINWGAWSEIGAATGASVAARLRQGGIGTIAPADGLTALGQLLRAQPVQVGVLPIDWEHFGAQLRAGGVPLLEDFLGAPRAGGRTAAPQAGVLLRRLEQTAATERGEVIRQFLETEVRRVLRLDPAQPLDPRQGFFEMGMDSLMAVELRNRLQTQLGSAVPLSATALFDHPSVTALAAYLSSQLLGLPQSVRPARRRRATQEPIAIIGLGCRLPGAASAAEFWELLQTGRDAIREVPADRWDVDAYYDPDPSAPGKMTSRYGGFLTDIDRFDASFFGIAPREAVSMDPQQRLLLEVTVEALERAGLPLEGLAGSSTGVFVGISGSDYARHLMARGEQSVDAYLGTGTAHSVAAG
jgi:candicidin polyketide synthase FscE